MTDTGEQVAARLSSLVSEHNGDVAYVCTAMINAIHAGDYVATFTYVDEVL